MKRFVPPTPWRCRTAVCALAVLLALAFGVHVQHAHAHEHESCCSVYVGDAAVAADAADEIHAGPAPPRDVALRQRPQSARPLTYHPRAPPPSH